MVTFFNILTHILVIVGIISVFYFIGYMIHRIDSILEKIIRITALSTGLLIYVGAKAIGISIPNLMIGGLGTLHPLSIGILGVIFPSFIGTFVAWYCIKNLNKHEDLAARLIILITTFIVVMFSDVYVASYSSNARIEGLNLSLLPNLTFTVGLSLYVIFKFRSDEIQFKKGKETKSPE